MNLAASLIAISFVVMIAIGVLALFKAGQSSKSSNADDPEDRDEEQ